MSPHDPPRSRRRRWLWILGGLAGGFVLLAAILLPRLLDVERHRGLIERELQKATGWEASLGSIDLSLLRGLALTVRPAGLAAPDGSSRFDADRISIRAPWGPLLRGRLDIESIELERPKIRVVRPDLERGWVLPLPPEGASAPAAVPTESAGGAAVTIGRLVVRDGALSVEDRSVDPPRLLAIENVDIEVDPANAQIDGAGEVLGAKLSWSGSPESGLQLTLDGLATEMLGPWVGNGVLHPGGRLAGSIVISPGGGVGGKLTGESLRLLAGTSELPSTELEFRLEPAGAGWRSDFLELRAGTARVVGRGTLVPLALELEMPATPLATALELTEAIVPLGLDVSPPGEARLEARVDLDDAGALVYEAQGEISAARLVAAEILPAANDVRVAFRLSRAGRLSLRIQEGSVGGGPLEGTIEIDSIQPVGTLTFDGGLIGASFGALIGGFVGSVGERVTGPSTVRGRIAVDLTGGTLDASSIGGRLSFGADDVDLEGWDLENELRDELRQKLGALAEVAALVDPDLQKELAPEESGEGASISRLLDHLKAEVSFDAIPWGLQSLELRTGRVAAVGEGTFDPVTGAVELRCTALLDPDLTAEYVERHSVLRSLVDDRGRLALPMSLSGPMTDPEIGLELSDLAPEPEDAVRGLIEGLFDRRKKRKR
ncbi:MAG: AsmA family protein [Planctomycetota bacterium]|jgi:hypothetical protein